MCNKNKDGIRLLAGIIYSRLAEDTEKYRQQVKIVQAIQRERVATCMATGISKKESQFKKISALVSYDRIRWRCLREVMQSD